MMKQYMEIKERYRDCILFFRMGDFYEMFFEDAMIASRILEIALTTRDKNKKNPIPMCGVPYHSADPYIQKLLKEGYKVAICEQIGDPQGSGRIVEREVVRVITPGVPVEEGMEPKDHNYLLALCPDGGGYGIAYVDPTTGESGLTQVGNEKELEDELSRIEPRELLLPEEAKETTLPSLLSRITNPPSLTYLDGFEKDSIEPLKRYFGTEWVREVLSLGVNGAIRAVNMLLRYLKETRKVEPHYIKKPLAYRVKDYMILDTMTRRNLELVQSLRDGTKRGSLLGVLDRTRTAMGGRLLKNWISFPLIRAERIVWRLDAVEELKEERALRAKLAEDLKGIHDLERLINKMVVGVAGPRDLLSLGESLKRIPRIRSNLGNFRSRAIEEIRSGLDGHEGVVDLVERAISKDPPVSFRDGGVIREGFNRELDELREIKRTGKEWLLALERKEKERTGISSLKVGYSRIFGYYIEVTKANLSLVPDYYIRRQTLVNAERFITPELKDYEAKILKAEERIVEIESSIFKEVVKRIGRQVKGIQKTASMIATLDALISLAEVADEYDYAKPCVEEGEATEIKEGRHPVVERMVEERFVPNDTVLDCNENRLLVITGPNMAGKSTYLRQVVLITLMAQMGSFVPATGAKIGIVDRIFARIGAMDDISKGQSTFMVEMGETAHILRFATRRSLIILDEIGRGTSTFDGISIAWAVAEYIHDTIRAKTLFATHYHELTDLALTREGVKNYNISVREWGDRIIFLRRIAPGGMSRSYGIQVAKLAGLPREVIKRAKDILSNLQKGELDYTGMPRFLGSAKKEERRTYQLNLFTLPSHPVIEEVKGLDPDRITPLEALQKLYHLKDLLEKNG